VIEIRRIEIPDRLRAVDERRLGELVESIKCNGVLEPPIVDEHLALIAGGRRVRAAKLAGLEKIGVIVRALDPVRRELAEIDENLCRLELTPLERGEHIARRKQLYEQLHPETRPGGAPGKAGGGKKPSGKVSFVVDAAERTGRGASTISEDCRIGSMAPEVRKALKGTGAAKRKSELLLLAKQLPSDQVAIAGQLRDGTASSVAEAVRRLDQERGRCVDGEECPSVSTTPDDDDVEAVDDVGGEGVEEDDEPGSLPAIFSHLEQLQGLRDQVAAMLELARQLERTWTDDPAPDVTPALAAAYL
jgi:ParB family chromosome partitioning protein